MRGLLDRVTDDTHLVGHDYGGLLAAMIAARRPVRSLTLSSTALGLGWLPAWLTAMPPLHWYFYRRHAGARWLELGVSPAHWSLFGNLWPAACVLAERMAQIDFRGRRVLEVGSGLGLASLVAQSRGADVTASDIHPLCQLFLDGNAVRNQMPKIPFHRADWAETESPLGRFSLIIASDVLYEGNHAALLSGLAPKKDGDHITRAARLPTSTEPTCFAMPWVMAGLIVYLAT